MSKRQHEVFSQANSGRRMPQVASTPLTRAQATWLNEQAGKLFDRYYFKDEREVQFDALLQEAHDHKKAAAHE